MSQENVDVAKAAYAVWRLPNGVSDSAADCR